MSADVLRRRVDDSVGSQRQGLLQVRRSEGVVDYEQRPAVMGERGDVRDSEQGVGRSLNPYQSRPTGGKGSLHGTGIGHVHRLVANVPAGEHLVEKPERAAVGIVGDKYVITRLAGRA